MALVFNRDFDPRYGEAVPVAPGVRRVTARNPGPFTFHGTNTFLIGDDPIAVLDPGPADPAHIEALLAAIGTVRISHVLVSHTHRDHSPAARLLQLRTGAPMLAAGLHRPARPLSPDAGETLDASADLDFVPDRIVADGEVLASGEYRLQAIATPGHAANHLAFALLGSDLLFSGDHVMGWATTVVAPPDGSMADYMASLDKLLARPESRYLPAHGGDIRQAPAFVRALKTHRKMREAAILEALASGDRTIRQLVARIYRDLAPQLHAAAALSTLAHLQDLAERGQVHSEGDGRYSPAGASSGGADSAAASPGLSSSGEASVAGSSVAGGAGAGGGTSDAA